MKRSSAFNLSSLIVLEVILLIVMGLLGPEVFQWGLCGMAFLPFLWLFIGMVES